MIFAQSRTVYTPETPVAFPPQFDLPVFREMCGIQDEQSDELFLKNLQGASEWLEKKMRGSILKNNYRDKFVVHPYDNEFVFAGLDAEITNVLAENDLNVVQTVTQYQKQPYYNNGSVSVIIPNIYSYKYVFIQGVAGGNRQDIDQAIVLAFGYLVDKRKENLQAINDLVSGYAV